MHNLAQLGVKKKAESSVRNTTQVTRHFQWETPLLSLAAENQLTLLIQIDPEREDSS